jgi:DNA helicase-2/ATP-dependent DNA helicase PcrA
MAKIMINVSEAQLRVIKADIGQPIQVLASAGAGKTRVLTERIRHILQNTKKDGVIALTFTNKAAEEMDTRLEDIDEANNRCFISTIHGIAQRVLEQYGNTIGLPSELHIYEREQDKKAIFLQSLLDNGIDIDTFFDSRDEKDRNRKIQRYMEQFSVVKRELFTENEIKEAYTDEDNLWQLFQGYQEALLASGGIDFDDILVYAHRILLEQEWCGDIYRAKYKHVCVDEAQDLNRAQYEFIKMFCGEQIKSLMMVGDPNQMIYGFNGSSHEYLCKRFIDDFSPTKFELKENYRSSKAIIRLANKLRPNSQVEATFALDGNSEIKNLQTEEEEATWIYNKIEELLLLKTHQEIEGDITLNKMVVIARNRFVLNALEKVLDEKGINYSLKKAERQTEPTSTFGKILDLAIRLKLNPKDWIDGKKLCAVLKIGTPNGWTEEHILNSFADTAKNADIYFPEIQEQLLKTIESLDFEKPNIPKFCNEFETKLKALVSDNNSDEILAELERSIQELADFRNCWTLLKRKGLGDSLLSFRNAMALGQLSDDVNPHGLTLSTVHTMKGLEKDIVFLTSMCEGVFPDYRATTNKEIEEERNSAFVAVTRARRWIYITFPTQRKMPWGVSKNQKPSRFITEMQN